MSMYLHSLESLGLIFYKYRRSVLDTLRQHILTTRLGLTTTRGGYTRYWGWRHFREDIPRAVVGVFYGFAQTFFE